MLSNLRTFYALLQSPPKCPYYRRLVYNNNRIDNLQYLPLTFFGPHRELSTAVSTKKKRISRNRSKTNVPSRKPVSFNIADYVYTMHGITDHLVVNNEKINNSEILTSTSTNQKKTSNRRHFLTRSPDYTDVHHKLLLEILADEASTPITRFSHKQILQLENAFVYKMKELTIQEIFLVARYFFLIKHRAPKYLTTLFEYVDNNFDAIVSIESNYLKRTMFYIYFHGSCPECLLHKIEQHLLANVDDLSLTDIGLACLGYFRANRRIQSFELLDQIAEKTIKKDQIFEPNHLINMLKSFRHAGYSKISYFEKLANFLVSKKNLSDMTLNQVMHIIMTFASTRIHHPDLIRECIRRSVELIQSSSSLSSVRTKELGRIVWALGTLGVDPEELSKVKILIDAHTEIEKTGEGTWSGREYPESISDTVMGSVFLGIFPHELISLILEEKTVNVLQALRGLEKKMQMLFIHHTMNIECPDYLGPKLKPFTVSQFELKDRNRAVQFELDTRPGLLTVFKELTSILGEDKVHCHMILPHFTTADIEIQLDAENKPVFFKPETVSTETDKSWKTQQQVTFNLLEMLKNPSQKLSDSSAPRVSRRIAVQIIGRNQCATNHGQCLMGNHRTKLRQLSVLDYEVLILMPANIAALEKISEQNRREWILQNVIQKLSITLCPENL